MYHNSEKIPELIQFTQLKRPPQYLLKPLILFIFLLLLWYFMPGLLQKIDVTVGSIDPSVWLLILLSFICFFAVTALSWWLLKQFWLIMGLPSFKLMISQYNTLQLWQQLTFYWVSFGLVLLAALGCLGAIF